MGKQPDDTTHGTTHDTTPYPPAITRRALLRTGLGVAGAGLLAGCGLGHVPSSPQQTTATPTSLPTAIPSPTADTRPVTIAITGDIMMARSVGARIMSADSLYPFAGTAEAL